jgi:hypothetical protein
MSGGESYGKSLFLCLDEASVQDNGHVFSWRLEQPIVNTQDGDTYPYPKRPMRMGIVSFVIEPKDATHAAFPTGYFRIDIENVSTCNYTKDGETGVIFPTNFINTNAVAPGVQYKPNYINYADVNFTELRTIRARINYRVAGTPGSSASNHTWLSLTGSHPGGDALYTGGFLELRFI